MALTHNFFKIIFLKTIFLQQAFSKLFGYKDSSRAHFSSQPGYVVVEDGAGHAAEERALNVQRGVVDKAHGVF